MFLIVFSLVNPYVQGLWPTGKHGLDSGLDFGLDSGLDPGLDPGLDFIKRS